MAKVLHLSKLSRGHVELSESGSRLEIYADQTERPLVHTSKKNQLPYVPKTYSTKRGPLVLFAESGLLKTSKSKVFRDKRLVHHDINSPSLLSPPPLRFGELKRSILAYGGTPENQFTDGVVDEDGTFIYMKLSSKKRPHPSKYAGTNPNVILKRRYMITSSEDKKRELDSVLGSDYSNSRNLRHSMMKTHVLSDEISLIPPIYRNPDIAQHSPSILSNVYRFFQIENTLPANENENTEQKNLEYPDTLQIIDSKGSHLSYETLEQSEKERILADLLIQTALHNIAEQQDIEVFEDALNRVKDSDINNSLSSIDIPVLIEESSVPLLQSDTTSDHQQPIKSRQTSSELLTQQQHYMFGKMQGSRWARNRPVYSNVLPTKSKNQTNENDQNSDELNNEYTQTTSDFVHSQIFRASQMLAPVKTSAHQDSSTARNQQQQYSSKLPSKLRKSHEIDSNQHKKSTYKDDSQHVPSPIESQHDKTNQSIDKREKSLTNLFHRQRSSKSSKPNPSRQGTGKTFATDRCVTSPLSIREEAERLLAIDSSDEDQDEDNNGAHTTVLDPAEERLVHNASHSPRTKTDDEHDQHLHPSAMNVTENSVVQPEIHLQRSAYTHRSHATTKSKNSSIVPPGALLIAPDGQILSVGGPVGHFENDYGEYLTTHEPFAHQPSTSSFLIENSDQQPSVVAPCVPMVLGTKRERLPDETVIRRTMNLTGGDINSQIDFQSWSYEMPIEKRRAPPQPYTFIAPPPPLGLSAFTGRKYHQQKRNVQEVHDHAMLHSTLSMHSEAVQPQRTVPHSNSRLRPIAESNSPLFGFTSWTYQRPPTPPIVKRPYLYRPDYRPAGSHGYKHPMGDTETLIRRTINIHAGDIDASLSFTIWVYDMWITDLVKNGADPNYIKQVKSLFDLFKQRRLSKVDLQDKEFLSTLARHAQALARIVLTRSNSGYHLAEDAQFAIIESLRNLKHLLDQRLASVSDDVYREILRDTLQHVLKKGNLEHLQITDDVLLALMDYPIEAFEIYSDPQTGDEYIRIKSAYQIRKNKIKAKKTKKKTKTVIISEEISPDDFQQAIDEQTSEYVYRFRREIAEQKGFMDLISINFDIIKDKNTGERFVQIKTLPKNLDFQVEIFIDPDTGKQILVLKKEVLKTPPLIQSDITIEDFELVTDERTGETVLRLKADVAARKGLTSLAQTNFEVAMDPTTGQTIVRMKNDESNQMGGGRVEIITDAVTGKQTIRMIVDNDDNEESDEPIVTVTENDIDLNDFERVIDPLTGREVLRMRADVLKAKGLEELANAEFEIVVDAVTGQATVVLKTPASDLSGGMNTNFEIVVDIKTGKQKIIKRTVTEPEDDHVDVIESQLNADDFERFIDPVTGLEVLRLKKGAAARKGLTDLLDVEFEMVTNADGKQTIVVKGGGNQGNTGDAKFELTTDASGRTTIKLKKERPPTPDLEITEKSIDINDFEEVIDSKTGVKVLKLKVDIAKRAGMTELLNAEFETYIDPKTGKQAIRIKQTDGNGPDDVKFEIVTDASGKQVLRMVQEIHKTIEVTNSDVSTNDFEEVIDVKTGKKVLRMKKEVAKRKGFVDMDNVDFEVVIDAKTGQEVIQIKAGTGKTSKGHVTFEMITDPKTGQQTLRMKQEVEVEFEKIENDLNNEDFEECIDQVTGERILKLTAEAAARKGLGDLRDVAFEVYVDPTTGKEQIRMKDGKAGGDQKFELYIDKKTGQQKIVLKRPKGRTPPPIEKSIDVNDFEKVIDPNTGKEFYRFTDEAIRRKGLTNVKDMEFDIEIDSTTGKAVMKPKVSIVNGQKVEVIIDPTTGEQTIRIVQEKPSEKLATITTTIDLDENAITVHTDPKTGKETIHLSKDLMENYGLENVEFEQVIDETTGQKVYRMKPVMGKDGKVYELITDPTTGKQSLQVKESVTQQQLTTLIESREAKGLRIPRPASGKTRISGFTEEMRDTFPTGISTRTKKKVTSSSPAGSMTPSPSDNLPTGNRRQSQVSFKQKPIRVKSPSGQEYEIEWTSDDEKELDGLSVYEQRRRREQMLGEKKRKVADMKRQEELAIQQRLKKQRESLVGTLDQPGELLNHEEQERERDLRKLDADREGLTEEEYQARRKKLLTERTRVLKTAYDRKIDRLKRQTGAADGGHVDDKQAAQLEEELEAQIRAEEDLLLSMMNPEEREEYIRARNEERARQRLLDDRERLKREEELQAALAETKRMASIRAAEIMAAELQKRSSNSAYAELKDLVTEQKVSRAFTYSYYSLLQFLSASSSSNPVD